MNKYENTQSELTQRQNEMLSVVIHYLENNEPQDNVFYDEAECDAYCIAEDLKIAFDLEEIE